ncbi:flagellin domain protein [Spirochaeta thermophila DSM 6578]|uniref:Flagellin n=1 Tax=Winmispira thermophila (strain ATCC 700085 / DSM 6578 / Z-1203) TaxID=869211 RepID=G0GFW4_WINT7|nr:flagellin [Spirochaeta thermophila]AEJ61657.1 flagellin domain protein [Spirochaeta thermophila DSM 6578]
MIINHNMSALYANRTLAERDTAITKNIEKLSSGLRITRAADDAAGLAISEKMRSQIRGLNQAARNIQDAVSFIQTSEGYLQETQDILHRLRELSVQAANGIYSDEDRLQIQVEVSQLVDEINRIASHAQFNGMNLLTGGFAPNGPRSLTIQVGANMDQQERIYIGTMTAEALLGGQNAGAGALVSISTPEDANRTIGQVDTALRIVSKQRADLGAYQNRFEMAWKGVSVAAENIQAAESRIRDVDMASEMVEYVKNQILTQANTAMLAQANMKTQSVLQLLG